MHITIKIVTFVLFILSDSVYTKQGKDKKLTSMSATNLNIVDFIDNGWIELQPYDYHYETKYIVKCDAHFIINSDSAFVHKKFKLKSKKEFSLNKKSFNYHWAPVSDFKIKNMPLCAKKCKFQGILANGVVKVDSTKFTPQASNATKSALAFPFIELIENSRVKYECAEGFQLRKVTTDSQNHAQLLASNFATEECQLTPYELQMRSEYDNNARKSNKKNKEKNKSKEDENDDQEEKEEDDDDEESKENDKRGLVISSSSHASLMSTPSHVYECIKFCKPLIQPGQKNMNGFVTPVRDFYLPGDHLTYLCNEGYAIEIPVVVGVSDRSSNNESQTITQRMGNTNTFDCSTNGTWHLLLTSKGNANIIDHLDRPYSRLPTISLAQCVELRELLRQQDTDASSSVAIINADQSVIVAEPKIDFWLPTNDQLVYTELNVRSLCLMLTIGGILTVFLVLSVIALKFYRTRREHMILFSSFLSPTHDRFEASGSGGEEGADSGSSSSSSTFHSVTETTCRHHRHLSTPVIPRTVPSLNSNLANSCHNAGSDANQIGCLPSYEEAVLQRNPEQTTNIIPVGLTLISSPISSLFQPLSQQQIVRSNPSTINSATSTPATFATPPLTFTSNPFAPSHQLFATTSEEKQILATSSPPPYNESAASNELTTLSDAGSGVTPGFINLAAQVVSNAATSISSRSGSIRSNFTIRSANPSIRTTNSIGTSSSINMAAQPTGSAKSGGHHRKNSKSSRSRAHGYHRHVNHSQHKNGTSSTAAASTASSVIADASQISTSAEDAVTTRTVASFQSNKSDASKIALKGSETSLCTMNNSGNVSVTLPIESCSRNVIANSEQSVTFNDENERLLASPSTSSSSSTADS